MSKLLLALTLAGAGVLLAVSLAFADGGPHGGFTNTSDGCAGCHRAHTARASSLLTTDQASLCFSCHDGTGSKLDSWDGASLSATIATRSTNGQPAGIGGALRGGGFVYSRIDSGNPTTPGAALANTAPGAKVTSAHVKWAGNALTAQGVMWGSGTTGQGKTGVSLACGDCHNPHGNGNYRILRPLPNNAVATAGVTLADQATKTYTTSNYWNTYSGGPAATFPWTSQQMSDWCATCHTRYDGGNATDTTVFPYRHESGGTTAYSAGANSPYNGTSYTAGCLQCHVSHGSNASVAGDGKTTFSSSMAWPGTTTARGNESTLLKIDNRGTCVACHGTKP